MTANLQGPNVTITTSVPNHLQIDSESVSLEASIENALKTNFKAAFGVDFHFTTSPTSDFMELRNRVDEDKSIRSELLHEVFLDTKQLELLQDKAWLKAVYKVDLASNEEEFLYYNLKVAFKEPNAQGTHYLNFQEIFEKQEIEKWLQETYKLSLEELIPFQLHRLVRWKKDFKLDRYPSLSFTVQLDSLRMDDKEYYEVGTIRIRHSKHQSMKLGEVVGSAVHFLRQIGLEDFQISQKPAPSKFCAQAFADERSGYTIPAKKKWAEEIISRPSSAQYKHFIKCYSDDNPFA